MPTLRQLIIRLAASDAKLRPHLLGLVRTAGFSSTMLNQVVRGEAQRLGLGNADQALATREVSRKADAFVRALSNALGAWDQARTLTGGVPAAMRKGVALLAYAAMERGANAAQWKVYTDEPRKLIEFLRGSLRKTHRELKDAVFQAALETGS